MAALLGVEMAQAAAICEQAAPFTREDGSTVRQVVSPANDNGGGQVVISGDRAAVERAIEVARGQGVKRAMLLPVSAPFHCALMAPAAQVMAEALEQAAMASPVVPLIANATASKASDPAEIRQLLVQQVTQTVRWRESVVAAIAMGVDSFVELGAGKVLAGLVKRIAPAARTASAGTPGEIEALLKAL